MKQRALRILGRVAILGITSLLVLWAAGAFRRHRIAPGPVADIARLEAPAKTAQAVRETTPVCEEVVGTVESRTRVAISAQISARVVSVARDVGNQVSAGDVVVRLDERELAARVGQAEHALAAADATRARAEQARLQGEAQLTLVTARHERVQRYFERGAATAEQVEEASAELAQAAAQLRGAEAGLAAAFEQREQAREGVAEARVALGYATIASPVGGVVARREVEPGEIAWPGRNLLVVHDPDALRLSAPVREGLVELVRVGARLEVDLPAAHQRITGIVSEVIPSGDPRTRTFDVRVDLDAVERVYPGMFGRLRLEVGRRERVRVPAAAVLRVGQLEMVLVQQDGSWVRRLVSTGESLGEGAVELLSGLRGGETVGLGEVAP